MRRFFEFWIGFTVGTLLFELLNQRGRLTWAAGQRALLSGLIAALLLTLYYRWRARRESSRRGAA